MGTIRKVGNDYYIEFEARGLLYQQKAGPDEAAAWRLLAEVESKIQQGQMGIMVRDVTTEIFWEDFFRDVVSEQTPRTQTRFVALIKNFQTFLRKKHPSLEKLSQVTPKVIEDYKTYFLAGLSGKVPNPHLVNFTLFLLKEVLDYAIKLGYLNDNPVLHVRFLKDARKRACRYLSSQDVETILGYKLEILPMIRLILETGMRWQEIVVLCWKNISSEKILFDREIPLTTAAIDVLKNQEPSRAKGELVFYSSRTGKPWALNEIRKELEGALKNVAGEEKFSMEVFRHTFAQRILQTRI
ncbi:MAG: site-specific integrase, partial [Candidatus Omnitrophica bacterium]|nr:site-specific integrase [Candidatus Omnitrophota bacterium]